QIATAIVGTSIRPKHTQFRGGSRSEIDYTVHGISPALLPPIHPHRRGPRDFVVGLAHADIVVMHAVARVRVGPGLLALSAGALQVCDDLAVFQYFDGLQILRSDDVDLKLRGGVGLELVAHDVRAALHIANDVVGCAISVTLAHAVDDRLSVELFT